MQNREWRERNADCLKKRWQRYYAENRDAIIAYVTTWGKENPDRRAEHRQRWIETNPDKVIEHRRASNFTRRGVPPTSLARDYFKILEGDPCSYCGALMEELDHIVPVARGGDGEWDNYTAACGPCNRMKSADSFLSFLLKSRPA